jgi:hypothetical protein
MFVVKQELPDGVTDSAFVINQQYAFPEAWLR